MAQQKTRAAVPRGRATPAPERRAPMTRIRIDDLPVAEELTPEQEALIQGAGLKSFRPSLEAMEVRDVPARIAPGLDLSGTVLTIQGTPAADKGQASIVLNTSGGPIV